MLSNPAVLLLTVDDAAVLSGLACEGRYNLNASDGAILARFLRYARAETASAGIRLLVAADRRLLRDAEAEGLRTLNPEAVPPGDLPRLLATAAG